MTVIRCFLLTERQRTRSQCGGAPGQCSDEDESVGAAEDRGLEEGVQRGAATQQP